MALPMRTIPFPPPAASLAAPSPTAERVRLSVAPALPSLSADQAQRWAGHYNTRFPESAARVQRQQWYTDLSTIAITPTRGMIHYEVVGSWLCLRRPINHRWSHHLIAGYEVGAAYNKAVEHILANHQLANHRYLLTMEDDNLPPPDGLLMLFEHMDQYDVIGGLYWSKGEQAFPMVFGDPARPDTRFRIQPPRAHTIQPVRGTGMGFTLFKLDIFKQVAPPWFVTEQADLRVIGHDLYFFEKIYQLGYKTAVDTRVRVGHLDVHSGVIW